VGAVLHVLAVGLEHLRVRARLREDLSEHAEVEPDRGARPRPSASADGVGVHHHVDERLYLGGLPGLPDVAQRRAQLLEEGRTLSKVFALAAAHEVEGSLAGLGDRGRHAALEVTRLPAFFARRSISTWVLGVMVAQLTKTFPRALTRSESPVSAKRRAARRRR
jgi:hypothetical protein